MDRLVNSLPIIAILGLVWWGVNHPPKARNSTFLVPQSGGGSKTISVQDLAEAPSADPARNLPQYEVVPGSIHDGDTLRVRSQTGQVLKVRFACIDAPELSQPLGEESRNYLRSLINQANGKLKLHIVDTDRYGRTVAELWTDRGLVQSYMAQAGMAFAYDRYKENCSQWESVKNAEKYAIENKLGVWKMPNFEHPWDYRRKHRN